MKIHVLLLISLSLFAGESYSKEYKYSDAVNCSPQFQGDIDKATPGEEVEVGLALRKMLHLDLSSKVDTLYYEPNDHPEYKNTKLHYQDWINAYFKSGVKNSVECF
ncbi:hypothetical protein, partial [Microbulbifer halophilus]|uniref:hypothetical protein n=1 Tax=Microbulbifer halophilus TaxID=453963 RepID=UPI00224499AB